MFTIRREQMETLRIHVVAQYVEQAVRRIRAQFPATCAALGPDGTEALVKDGVARAERHGIEENREVDRFIDLMLRLAPTFDELPAFAWARAILDTGDLDERAKLDLIYASRELDSAGANG
jgi:hypothetical protein